jgi:transposase
VCSLTEKRLVKHGFRFELDPNGVQRSRLAKSVGASRYVYNWGLAESQRSYQLKGERPKLREMKSRLVDLKKGDCPWLYEVSAHIGQQALVDLDKAFNRFFKGLKGEGPKSGFPRFKRKGERDSARLYDVKPALDRDENAAANLRAYGLRDLGMVPLPEGLREVTPVGEEGSGLRRQPRVKPASLKQEASDCREHDGSRRRDSKAPLVSA